MYVLRIKDIVLMFCHQANDKIARIFGTFTVSPPTATGFFDVTLTKKFLEVLNVV